MTAKKESKAVTPPTVQPVAASAPAPVVVVAPTPKYFVAEGKSVTSKKGILTAKDGEVKAEFFYGGVEAIATLLEVGALIQK
jgi:hypothetical protein